VVVELEVAGAGYVNCGTDWDQGEDEEIGWWCGGLVPCCDVLGGGRRRGVVGVDGEDW